MLLIAGAVIASQKDKQLYIILTGRKDEIQAELDRHKYDKSRFEIVDCPDVIDMNDVPTEAIKKKGSSLIHACLSTDKSAVLTGRPYALPNRCSKDPLWDFPRRNPPLRKPKPESHRKR